jgi:drug/metabolite transporter (DMT)-like permease
VIFPNLFFFYAAKEIQASIIALGIALVPTLTLTGAILLKREKLTLRRCTGICLGAVGVMMILLPKTTLPKIDDTFFSLAAFAGAACYAAEHLYIEVRAPSDIGIDKLLFLMFSSVSVLLLPKFRVKSRTCYTWHQAVIPIAPWLDTSDPWGEMRQ